MLRTTFGRNLTRIRRKRKDQSISALYNDLWWCSRHSNKADLFSPPFVLCKHFGHTSADIQDCCPGYQSLSKGQGLRESFRRDRRGADLCHIWGRIHGHLHCVTKAATDIMLPLTHCTFLETADLRSDVPAHIMWEKPPSTGKCFTFDTGHTHRIATSRPFRSTFLKQAGNQLSLSKQLC